MPSPIGSFDLAAPLRCVSCGLRGEPLCSSCGSSVRPAGGVTLDGLDHVRARWDYAEGARDLVLGLKLSGRLVYADPLIEGLASLARRRGTQAAIVTWPPCSRAAKRRRGFDHAEVLARGLAERLGLLAAPLIQRVGRASDQAELTGSERRLNLLGAFAARPASGAVLLVDDVVTTGATLQACATSLRAAGASRIEAFVACSAFS
jgi:ComF family protein